MLEDTVSDIYKLCNSKIPVYCSFTSTFSLSILPSKELIASDDGMMMGSLTWLELLVLGWFFLKLVDKYISAFCTFQTVFTSVIQNAVEVIRQYQIWTQG